MLSRSKGRHKITFQQLPLSLNSKVTKIIIIGIGLVSSLTAFLMILKFAGLKPDYLKVFGISIQSIALVANTLTGFAQGLVGKLAVL
jgi:hypothetical protein